MPRINHEILRWARETAHLSKEDAAKKLGIKDSQRTSAVEKLSSLEKGDVPPTRPTLVKMAKHYRRPLLTFYLSEVPRKGNRGQDFRTIPEAVEDSQKAWVDVVIRDIRTRQSLVRSILEDEDEAIRLPFINSLEMSEGVNVAVASIKQHLGWDLNEYRDHPNIEKAFAFLRGKTEDVGVYVILVDNLGNHLTTIDPEAFRGFALADDFAPFIAINANDSKGAWIFTLVHEFVHLLLGATGVSGSSYQDQGIEKFCNDAASEFLVPMREIRELPINNRTDFQEAKDIIKQFALSSKVSNTMVAYKLCRADFITFEKFLKFKASFKEDWEKFKNQERLKAKEKGVKGLYYPTKKQRVGPTLINLISRMMYEGAITTTKAGKVLGVKAQNVQGVIENNSSNVLRNMA